MQIGGLPLHPLVVHAAIALVPLAALLSWALAAVPGWRWLTRWAALLATLGAVGAVVVARVSGESLLESKPFLTSSDSPLRDVIETHENRAGLLLWAVLLLLVVVLLAFWSLPARSGLVSGRLEHRGSAGPAAVRVVAALLVVAGAVALVLVVLTGDAGARAVWGGG